METTMVFILTNNIGCLVNGLKLTMLLQVHNTWGHLAVLLLVICGIECRAQGPGIIFLVLKDQKASLALAPHITLDSKMGRVACLPTKFIDEIAALSQETFWMIYLRLLYSELQGRHHDMGSSFYFQSDQLIPISVEHNSWFWQWCIWNFLISW